MPARIEAEGTQIYPSSSSHLLVHLELGTTSFVIDGVKGFISTVWQRLIGDVNGVLTAFGNVRYPFGSAFLSFLDGFGHAEGSFIEWIGETCVLCVKMCKSFSTTVCPLLVAVRFCIEGGLCQTTIIIYDDFFELAITFAGEQYVGARILEHRDEEGKYITLRIEILYRLEDTSPLPFPT